MRAAGIDPDAVVATLLRTLGDAHAGSSYRRKREVLHLLCLLTANGASRQQINAALVELFPNDDDTDRVSPQVSKRQVENASRLAASSSPELLGTAAPKLPRRKRHVAERKLWAFLRSVTQSTHVLQQQWTTHVLEFDRQHVATAALSRAVAKDELYREYCAAIVSTAKLVSEDHVEQPDDEQQRCLHINRFQFQCLKLLGHDGRHKYTTEDIISSSLFNQLLDFIVTRQTTARAGLDPCVTDNGYYNLGPGQAMSVSLDTLVRLASLLGVTDQLPSLAWTAVDLEREAALHNGAAAQGEQADEWSTFFANKEAPTFASVGKTEAQAILTYVTGRLTQLWSINHHECVFLCLGCKLGQRKFMWSQPTCFHQPHDAPLPSGVSRMIAFFERVQAAVDTVVAAAEQNLCRVRDGGDGSGDGDDGDDDDEEEEGEQEEEEDGVGGGGGGFRRGDRDGGGGGGGGGGPGGGGGGV